MKKYRRDKVIESTKVLRILLIDFLENKKEANTLKTKYKKEPNRKE
jgi:hypothetical protein